MKLIRFKNLRGWAYIRKTSDNHLPHYVDLTYRIAATVSKVLSLYTVSILTYNAAAIEWDLIGIGEQWFPWENT